MAVIELTSKTDHPKISTKVVRKHPECSNLQYLFVVIILTFILVISVITLRLFITKFSHGDKHTLHIKNNITLSFKNAHINVILPGKLKLISREEWQAKPPQAVPFPLETPVPYVLVTDTGTEDCSDQENCTSLLQLLQNDSNDTDIVYNFLVGGDGLAYEGRGWQNLGAHALWYNPKSIGIAMLGDFMENEPPAKQILATKQLIHQGVEQGFIAKDYKVFAPRQMDDVRNPGEKLYEEVKKWPHWAERPED